MPNVLFILKYALLHKIVQNIVQSFIQHVQCIRQEFQFFT